MTSGPRYWAFLSYSHADEAVAKRLHRELEGYSLPASVRKAHGLPRRLVPIFRDVDELEANSGLTTRLQNALDDSRWLIVLCSPASEQSPYVRAEVEYFLKKHGPGRILCVLADGRTPDIFPPAIRAMAEEPLAADCREGHDFELAKLKLVAAMATVGFTELRNREAQRQRRQRLAIGAAVAALAVGSLSYWDLYMRERADYYRDYVRQEGIWKGVDAISAEVASHRATAYLFRRRGRLHDPYRVEYFHGCGSRGTEKDGMTGWLHTASDDFATHNICSAEFEYQADGSMLREILLNPYGNQIETLTYTAPDLAQFTEGGFASAGGRSGIGYIQFTRDTRGFDVKQQFLLARGVPRPNDNHDYGYVYQYDDAGHMLRRSALDAAGQDTGEANRYRINDEGLSEGVDFLDAQDRPRLSRHGIASSRVERDRWGNATRVRYFGLEGEPVLNNYGVAEYRQAWDERGNLVERINLGIDGKPTLDDARASGSAGWRAQYDEHNFQLRVDFLAADGKIAENSEGVASYTLINDSLGNNIENHAFDAQGKPVESNRVTASIVKHVYDGQGNKTEEHFFDAQGRPTVTSWGAWLRDTYDAHGNIVRFEFFDGQDRPFALAHNCARLDVQRDERGNVLGASCFGADLKPALRKSGYSSFHNVFDDRGNRSEFRTFDTGGLPLADSNGVAIQRFGFDALGNETSVRYFGADERPARHRDGSWGVDREFDRRARATKITLVDAAGRPVIGKDGYAVKRVRYDAYGNILEENYSDVSDNPSLQLAQLLISYDHYNREIERRWLDAKGQPRKGSAVLRTERDASGRVRSERYLDGAGKPVNDADTGWAVHTISWSREGRKEEFLDAAGKPVKPKN